MNHPRLRNLDALRGLAIALMIAYHFSYDLNHFGFARFDFFNDPFWLNARTLILSLFLFVAGISLQIATHAGRDRERFRKRLLLIAGCALLISGTSYFMFGSRWIFFGVLHFIAVASVLGLAFVRRPWLALMTGIALIALDRSFAHPVFDHPALQWIGLMTYKPPTEDYVPLVPWFGVVLIGVFAGSRLVARTFPSAVEQADVAQLPLRWLASAGRHSLAIYMLHQPLLFGLLWTVKRVGA